MADVVSDAVLASLEENVSVMPERRGFGKQRGVPDSVFWLGPESDHLPQRLLPILVELEASFLGAADDFEKFAFRADDPMYQYHLEWPVFSSTQREPITRLAKYEVIGIRANQLSQAWAITEREMHDGFTNWCEQFRSRFRTSTKTRKYGPTRAVEWQLQLTIFGHEVTMTVPFIIEPGPNLDTVLKERIKPPTIPCVVVINDKYDATDFTTYRHHTQIQLPSIPEIRLQRHE